MAKLNVFREYSIMGIAVKIKLYANGKLLGKIGNCHLKRFSLPPGSYEIQAWIPSLIPFREHASQGSNRIKLIIDNNSEGHYLNLQPHPLFGFGRRYPSLRHPFRKAECWLLLRQDESFKKEINKFNNLSKQVEGLLSEYKYHPATWILILSMSVFAIISNIVQPHLYGVADGAAFMFGAAALLGLFSGRGNKRILARGWEYKMMFYNAIGIFLVVLTMPAGFYWEKMVYFAFIILAVFWGMNRLKHWPSKLKPLEDLEEKVATLEKSL